MDVLIETLKQAGQSPLPVVFPDGTRLLLLPGSGRVLGLYPAEDEANFLWTHPALADSTTASAFFASSGRLSQAERLSQAVWLNPGGDRTWLAPEIDLFIRDLSRQAETYAVPAALDPGNWMAVFPNRMTNTTRLRLYHPDREVALRLSKRLSPAANPLLGTPIENGGLSYAGYTLTTTLELEPQPDTPVRLGIWNLLQLPQPGQMWIPTRAPSQPQAVFGAFSPAELTLEPHLVRWDMASPGVDAKIALKAAPLTGRVGYLRQMPIQTGPQGMQDSQAERLGNTERFSPTVWDLVVREFTVDPAGDYVDALWDNPSDRGRLSQAGWVFQACCVRTGNARFNELEYHAPAAVTISGKNVSHDESRVWAFRGSRDAVAAAAQLLLAA